jgi:ATP-dependent Clp protease protease subunit
MEVILARHTGKDEETVRRDIERDKFLTADEAKEYGILDEVLTMIKRGTERTAEVVSSLPGEFSSSLQGRTAV